MFKMLMWMCVLVLCTSEASARPSVGAIRWDYWFENSPYTPLISTSWDNRRPAYATRNFDGSIQMRVDQQSVIDQEIIDASNAGIDYFSFVNYLGYDNDGLTFGPNRALGHFLKSPHKNKMKFSLILSTHHLGLAQFGDNSYAWRNTQNIIGNIISQPEYMYTQGRPILYIMDADHFESYWGSTAEARDKFIELKNYIHAKTGKEPLFVALSWTSYHHNILISKISGVFDGATSYANAPTFDNTDNSGFDWGTANTEIAYADLQKGCVGRDRKFRESFNSDTFVVPSITTGWDERPLKGTDPYYSRNLKNSWCAHATPTEIANHVKETLDWTQKRSKNLNTVLIYAWNEYLEGGFISPTAQEGGARLKALSLVLKNVTSASRELKKEFLQFAPGGTLSLINNCDTPGDYPNTCKATMNMSSAPGVVAIALTVKATGMAQEILAACVAPQGGSYSAPWINYDLVTQFKTYAVANCSSQSYLAGTLLSQMNLSFTNQSQVPTVPVTPSGPKLNVNKLHFAKSSVIELVNNSCSEPGDYTNTCTAQLQISREPQAATIILTVASSANNQEVMATCFNAQAGGSYKAPWINFDYKTTFKTYFSESCSVSDITPTKKMDQLELSFTK